MIIFKNQLPSIIKLKDFELLEIYQYTTNNINLFDEINEINTIRRWHLIELINKIEQSYCKIARTNKQAKLKINEIEKHILSIMFKYRQCNGYMLVLESYLNANLIKLKTNANITTSYN